MSIYQIKADVSSYKSFYPVEDDQNFELQVARYFDFRGAHREDWNGARVFLEDSSSNAKKLEMADIAFFSVCSFAYSEKSVELLKPILELSGELLPFEYEGRQWFVHNILNIASAVNYEKSEYELSELGKFDFSKRVDDESKLNDISLFKLKEDNYTVCRCRDIENKSYDFKYQVEKHKLKGLRFEFKA